MTHILRKATPADADALCLLGSATMLETYADLIDGDDILAHCRTRHASAVYSAWLADPDITIWIAQTARRTPIGYLVLMPATLPAENPDPRDLEIQRIYVLSRYHATGIAQALMQAAIAAAGPRRLVLGVLGVNARALAFYRRQGFTDIGTRIFSVGNATFDDLVLAR